MRLSLALFLLFCGAALGQQSRSVGLVVDVGPQCGLSIINSSVRIDNENGVIAGEIQLRYKIRTSRGGGGGSIKLRSAQPGSSLTYSSSLSGPGAAASGPQTILAGEFATVASFGPDTHSSRDGDTGTITWTRPGSDAPQWSLTIDCQ